MPFFLRKRLLKIAKVNANYFLRSAQVRKKKENFTVQIMHLTLVLLCCQIIFTEVKMHAESENAGRREVPAEKQEAVR